MCAAHLRRARDIAGASLFVCLVAGALAGAPAGAARALDAEPPGRQAQELGPRALQSDRPIGRAPAPASIEALPTDQLIVKFAPVPGAPSTASRATPARTLKLREAAGADLRFFRDMSGDAAVYKLPGRLPEAEVRAVADRIMSRAAELEVEYAEADAIVLPTDARSEPDAPGLIPNDAFFTNMWHLHGVSAANFGANLPGAWDITTGAMSVRVAVLDTGIRGEHPDLAGRIIGGYDFISDEPRANDGGGRDSDPTDAGDWITPVEAAGGVFAGCAVRNSSWHGTHVAGTIGAASHNGAGVAGINWVSKIVPIRVLGKCGGATSDIIDGMRWAAGLAVPGAPANPNPARVLNMSLGGARVCSVAEQLAVNDINAANAIVVVSAGNNNADTAGFSPASCNGVVNVAATNKIGDLAMYSNYGNKVTLSAPGGDTAFYGDSEGVLSTINLGATTPGASGYTWYQGTSMAAPHMAGIVSLMLSANGALSRNQVVHLLRGSATPFPDNSSCNTLVCGAGIVNAARAVRMAQTGLFQQLLPAVNRPGTLPVSQGIHGTVKLNGAPIAGIMVQLRRYSQASGTASTIATTTTDASGNFKFTSAATLAVSQAYYVRYVQSGDSSRLANWVTKYLPIYTAGQSINIGTFDITNIALSSPGSGATVTLPTVFSWVRRAAAPSDSYGFEVFDPADFNPSFFTDPPLGYANNYILQPGVLGSDFSAGTGYGWMVFAQSPEHGYGTSYFYRPVTFNNP